MLLAHISDLHFRSEGTKLYDFIDTNAKNAQLINHINSLSEKPDALIITGDIVNCGNEAEYQYARKVLQYLNLPIYLIPGNHDDKELFVRYFHDLCPVMGNDPENLFYAVDTDHARLYFIDTSQKGNPAGHITAATLKWLSNELSTHDKPSYIFMHHPPVDFGNCQMDLIRCLNGDQLLPLIDQHPHLERIFCGHVHRTMIAQYKQAIIMSIPGTVHQVPYHSTDLTDRYNEEEGMMFMHRLLPTTGLVSYNMPLAAIPSYLYQSSISCPGN